MQIEAIANNRYRVSPQLKLYECEGHSFVGRYLRRRAPQLGWYAGNASRPTGYFTIGNVLFKEKAMAKIDDFHCKGCKKWFDVFKKGSKKGYCLHCKPRQEPAK